MEDRVKWQIDGSISHVTNILHDIVQKTFSELYHRAICRDAPIYSIVDLKKNAEEVVKVDFMRPQSAIREKPRMDTEPSILRLKKPIQITPYNINKMESFESLGVLVGRRSALPKSADLKKSLLRKNTTTLQKEEDSKDFTQFKAFIDLGFTAAIDPEQEAIRKKKEEEISRRLEREEADLRKMMRKKKMGNDIIEALIKEKKQVVFTYDYDGLLLPVSRIDPNKLPSSHLEPSYIVDCQEPITQSRKTSQTSHSKTVKKVRIVQARSSKCSRQAQQQSTFYDSFYRMQVASGATVEIGDRVQVGRQTPPKTDFLTKQGRQPQRIQQRQYLEFVKFGNLVRSQLDQELQSKNKTMTLRPSSQNTDECPIQRDSSIKISNPALLKELTNELKNTDQSISSKRFVLKSKMKAINNPPLTVLDKFNIQSVWKTGDCGKMHQIGTTGTPFGEILKSRHSSKQRMRRTTVRG